MTITPEHRASLAVVEARLLLAMRECQLAVEAITETDDHTGGNHSDEACEIAKSSLQLHAVWRRIHQEIKQ